MAWVPVINLIGPTGPVGPSVMTLISLEGAVTITSPTSFEVTGGDAIHPCIVSTAETFNTQHQGLYVQTSIPGVVPGSGDILAMFVIDLNTSQACGFFFAELSGDLVWEARSNTGTSIASGTYDAGDIFSIYIDSQKAYFYKKGEYLCEDTIPSNIIYQYLSGLSQTLNTNTYTFENVRMYPTGKLGPTGPTGTTDVSTWAEYPASTGPVNFSGQDITNVNNIDTTNINNQPISDLLAIGRPVLVNYQSDDTVIDLTGNITGTPLLVNSYSTPPGGLPYDGILMFQLNYNIYPAGFDGAIGIQLEGNTGTYNYTNTIYAGSSVPMTSFVTTLGVPILANVAWTFNNFVNVIDEISSTMRTSWLVTYYPTP